MRPTRAAVATFVGIIGEPLIGVTIRASVAG
jgi:hypothetical protein